ncbi:MAG: hypothetical protein C4519_10790 [Desulfobacteraceae bacterium]|nr:MAG: hypothetical protein C4519_10790 [Desulfobacteraceae bacterium]
MFGHGPGHGLAAIDFTESNDFTHMMQRVHAPLLKLAPILIGLVTERQKTQIKPHMAVGYGTQVLLKSRHFDYSRIIHSNLNHQK